jgi:tetratricopeptide (TPR) repeat protein
MKEFIGRSDVLTPIGDFLRFNQTQIKIIGIYGPGGIGKTMILQHLRHDLISQGQATSTIIDLIDERLSQVRYLRSAIAQDINPNNTYFESYFQAIQQIDKDIDRLIKNRTLDQAYAHAEATFIKCYISAANGQPFFIFLDTVEMIGVNSKEWEDTILPFLNKLPNTNFIFAGRNPQSWRPLLSKIFIRANDLSIGIQGFDLVQTHAYFERTPGGKDISPDLIRKIWIMTQGRPILIDLAVEWLRRQMPFRSLRIVNEQDLEEAYHQAQHEDEPILLALDNGATLTLSELIQRFEEELIHNILELPLEYKLPILAIALLEDRISHSLVERILHKYVDSTINSHVVFQELMKFSFIKVLPHGQIMLHDEASRMIRDYRLWEQFDPFSETRVALLTMLGTYFDEEATRLETFDYTDTDNSDSFAQQENINQQVTRLRCNQVRIAFEADIDYGYEIFEQVYERAKHQRKFLLMSNLLETVSRHEAESNSEQRFAVKVELVNHYINTGRLNDAEKIIKDMLPLPDLPHIHEIEFYYHLGTIQILTGRGVSLAKEQYEKALKRSQEYDEVELQPKILNELGYIYRLQGYLLQAVDNYRRAFEQADALNNQTEKVSALINWSFVNSRTHEYDLAFKQLKDVYNYLIAQETIDRELLGRYHSVLGEVYRYSGKYQQAVEHYDLALSQFSDPDDKAWPGLVLSQRGVVFLNQFIKDPTRIDFAQAAEEDLNRAVELCQNSNLTNLPISLHRHGRYYLARKEYDRALKSFIEGYKRAEIQQDPQFVVENLISAAEVLFYNWQESRNSGLIKEIEMYLAKVRTLQGEGFEYPHLFGKGLQIVGNIYLEDANYEAALKNYLEAIPHLTSQEMFVGRDRLDRRLQEIEHIIEGMPQEWQVRWWTELLNGVSKSKFQEEPEVINYVAKKCAEVSNSKSGAE